MSASAQASPDSVIQAEAVAAARQQFQEFLDEWQHDGYREAAASYLTPEYQAQPGVPDGPQIVDGGIDSVVLDSWESPERFTLEVLLDLKFKGDPGAWGNGPNTRFVTVTRDSTAEHYRFGLATSR